MTRWPTEIYIHGMQLTSVSNNTKDNTVHDLELLTKGKRIGRKYALIEAGNIAWDGGEKVLANRFYAMAKEIAEV